MYVLIQLQNSNEFTKKKNQIKSWCKKYNQYNQNKSKTNEERKHHIMHASVWKKKSLSVKKNKNNFIDIIGDKFAMSIR